MTYYHGTTSHRFAPDDVILPGTEVGRWANWTVREDFTRRSLLSGRTVHPQEVVWVTPDLELAADWGYHSTLKATQAEIRKMPAGGVAVYEVEPIMLDWPTDPHGEGEACCAQARVIREVRFDEFPMDLCDGCGEVATVGLGSDNQLCAHCAEEEMTG
jgi:hypothetical protein